MISVIYCATVPCTYLSPSGDFYDFSPLSFCKYGFFKNIYWTILKNITSNTGSVVINNNDTFVINVCNNVEGCNNAAVCQNGQVNLGSSSSQTFLPSSGIKQ